MSSQWVVTRRPSRTPAAASRKAPLQTEAVSRAAAETSAIQPTTAASFTTSSTTPPGTSTTSIGG